ncbi:response regulator [Cytobacillus sp. BC1816]|uniref:response regulator n=1 Tax=Cytobacillus sp. BC1816 TaxID=3440154 RepID=UPI003F5142CE
MYNVFIVDDEPFIIEGMKALVQWEDYGLHVVGDASNGREALGKIECIQVDILLTDIMMPVMDGLQLISKIKERNPNIKCIILSGYQEFNYVKKGMELGIENYLLKPVNEQELHFTLLNCVEKLGKSTNHEEAYTILRDNTIWRGLNQEIDEKEWRDRIKLYNLEFECTNLAIVLIQFSNNLDNSFLAKVRFEVERKFQSVCIINPDGELILLAWAKNEDDIKEKADQLHRLLAITVPCMYFSSVGSLVHSIKDIHTSYDRAKELAGYRLVLKESHIITDDYTKQYSDTTISTTYEINDLKRYIVSLEREMAFRWIEGAFEQIAQSSKKVSPISIRGFAIDIITSVQKEVNDRAANQKVAIVKSILESHSLNQLGSILTEYIRTVFEKIEAKAGHHSPVIQSVIRHIHECYNEELSLKTLSYKFHINSIYLGQLFQKETGLVFSEYINHIRLEKAKQLLRDTHEKAGQIGKMVGYSDSAYFYKQFKKVVGITPSAWRTMNERPKNPV